MKSALYATVSNLVLGAAGQAAQRSTAKKSKRKAGAGKGARLHVVVLEQMLQLKPDNVPRRIRMPSRQQAQPALNDERSDGHASRDSDPSAPASVCQHQAVTVCSCENVGPEARERAHVRALAVKVQLFDAACGEGLALKPPT